MKSVLCLGLMLLALPTLGVERIFDFDAASVDRMPTGFRSLVAGPGKVGDWKIIENPSSSSASSIDSSVTNRFILAQTSKEPRANRIPILLFDEESFGDFKLTTRFKLESGIMEQAAGIIFRFQNESNFYLVQASAVAKKFRCFKVENGVIKPPIGPDLEIAAGVWHTLTVQCEGTRILCALDGNDAIKLVDNTARKSGKVGFCTQADTVGYFADARVNYTPRYPLAQVLVNDALQEFGRLLGLKIFAVRNDGESPVIIASNDRKEIGQAGGKIEQDVILAGRTYFGRDKESVTVTLPLRDRNGDSVAAVRVVMKSFPGQTEDNAQIRALPVIKMMQPRVQSLEALLE
jgi:hypothetical protein